ncbi:unnamed protein product [Onchocerca ochengi]|uniref:DUF1758 domain-containing protein n=1 Tax=Onchocerca ochengi TaxID=42157 RepID=A0A182EIP5_ONCOC|nr:unnamed protein product [Onchocerca ochengi]
MLATIVLKVDIPQIIVEIENEFVFFVKVITIQRYVKIQEDAIVLFDTGSESAFISRKLAQRLNLEGIQEKPDSDDDEGVLERFKETITKTNGRYQASCPWKKGISS